MTISDFILSLRLTEVRIPNHTVRNSTARLECHYDMDGEELYSVKWYKDGHEFYRYIPRSMPPALVFELPGINVDVSSPVSYQSRIIPYSGISFFISSCLTNI